MFLLNLLPTFNRQSTSKVPWAEVTCEYTQNAITTAHFSAITLNECDYVVTAGILISYALNGLKKLREIFRRFPFSWKS